MASKEASLISDPKEPKWVIDITKILKHQLETEHVRPHVSIFQVPDIITKKKPEAYEPQQIGLGPIHHFRPGPYKKTEQKKLEVVRKVLPNFENYSLTVENVWKVVPVVRSCYDMFLQDDDDSLARIYAIDGMFLLNLLVGPENKLLARDIMLIENQIPFIMLKEIHKALPSSSNEISSLVFRSICKIHSPLRLCSKSQAPASVEHLLHYMYYSIINNGSTVRPVQIEATVSQGLYAAPTRISKSARQVYKFTTEMPREEIVQVYKQTISFLETFLQSKILIPSVSKLYDQSEIRFKSLKKHQGIRNIKLFQKSIYLPCITLKNDSEVILRNLIAYETLMPNSDSFPLSEYMALMCGLVVNVDDVKILRSDDIIKGDLSDDEITKLFVGMKSSIPTLKTEGKSNLQEMIDYINKIYESSLRMKICLFLKKLAGWLLMVLKAIGGFVESSWKIIAFVTSIVTVFMLMWKAYCDVYGCDKTTLTLLPFASA